MTVENLTKHETLTFVHKALSNSLPPVFNNYFKLLNHSHNTRNGHLTLEIKGHKSSIAANLIKIMGAKLWNSLHNDLKTLTKTITFREKLKEFLS